MSDYYRFHNPEGAYFVSFAVVNWLNVFLNDSYKEIFVKSLKYCQKHKGLEVYAWCLMPNHVHLVYRSIGKQTPGTLLGDLKKFTSKKVVSAIKNNLHEPNKDVWLHFFRKAAKEVSNVQEFQFWRHDNHPIELWSNKYIRQKIRYVHNNPVEAGLVKYADQYPYSSAPNYADKKGLVPIVKALI